jgi:TetR/AcrR family transcriptional regulator, repressor for uid operon
MPKLNAATQAARRAHILDAAEHCFARAGFHRTSMQDICREAGVSAGALYVYFASKEDLIAGIAERDRNKLAGELALLAESPDLATALAKLGEQYTVEEPQHKRLMCVEIGLEATRNEAVGAIYRSVDNFVRQSFEQLFERAVAEGRIKPALSPKALAEIILVIGDGMFWRRAVDPNFDPKRVIPAITAIVSGLLNSAEPEPKRTSKVQAPKSDQTEKSGGRRGARS